MACTVEWWVAILMVVMMEVEVGVFVCSCFALGHAGFGFMGEGAGIMRACYDSEMALCSSDR